jgi:hypothetical protein
MRNCQEFDDGWEYSVPKDRSPELRVVCRAYVAAVVTIAAFLVVLALSMWLGFQAASRPAN